MKIKFVERNIPEERENNNDSFRVKYIDRKTFDMLHVKITRLVNGDVQLFEFDSNKLPDKDSIHFTTAVANNKLVISWRNTQPSESAQTKNSQEVPVNVKPLASIEKVSGKTAFPPIANQDSKILILGTMPGERSLKLQQYYGHAGNHFWKIIHTLFNKPFSVDYEERKRLLLEKGVALWDVLEYCESEGSADSDIANEKANDFVKFYKEHPGIKHVFFSSKKAEEFYVSYVGKKESINYGLLPSPRGTNTWKTFDDKVNEWKVIIKLIANV